jgi:GxxExxY protein
VKPPIRKEGLIYPELSYQIVGCAFEVWNELGPGHSEKIYQNAFAVVLKEKGLVFTEQVYYSLKFKNQIIGKAFLDFLVEEKIIVEIKKDVSFTKSNIEQVLNYLKLSNLKLALLINFTKHDVKYKRIVNVSEVS